MYHKHTAHLPEMFYSYYFSFRHICSTVSISHTVTSTALFTCNCTQNERTALKEKCPIVLLQQWPNNGIFSSILAMIYREHPVIKQHQVTVVNHANFYTQNVNYSQKYWFYTAFILLLYIFIWFSIWQGFSWIFLNSSICFH